MLNPLRRYMPRDRSIRVLAGAAFIDSIGGGLFLALIPVFVVQQLGVPASQVGLVVGAASLLGLASPMPAGWLADRLGAGPVWSFLLLGRAACYAGFLLVSSFTEYAVIACLCGLLDRASSTVQQTYVVRLAASDGRTEAMAVLRTVRNIGLSAGLLGAGLLIAIGTRQAFLAGFAANAASYLVLLTAVRRIERHRVAALPDETEITTRAAPAGDGTDTEPAAADPGRTPGPADAEKTLSPLRDRRYLMFSIGNAIVMLHDSVLFTLLPLWVITRTDLPPGVVGPLLALNTVLTVVVQVPMSRWVHGISAARRTALRSLLPMVIACGLFLAAEPATTGWAVVLVVGAVLLLTIGENMHTVAAFELAHRLAPQQAAGRYLGLFDMGIAAQLAFGPPVMTGLVLRGPIGWAALAAAFTAGTAALVAGAARRRTGATHPPDARRGRRPAHAGAGASTDPQPGS